MIHTQIKWYISQFNPSTKLSTSIKVMDQRNRTVSISFHGIRQHFFEVNFHVNTAVNTHDHMFLIKE